ncbi:MAG TPA: hypothetical protein VJ253_05835 [Dehalococcoidia bacterium]|nr:hypothetical protein [Dehalococcoidia bacterium]
MEVPLALLADYANVSREGKLNVMGVFNRIWANEFPATHPEMQLVFRLEAGPAERGQEKTIEVKLLDADGKEVQHLTGHLAVAQESQELTIQIDQILKLTNVVFEKAGAYRFDILVNGETKRTVEFAVERLPTE